MNKPPREQKTTHNCCVLSLKDETLKRKYFAIMNASSAAAHRTDYSHIKYEFKCLKCTKAQALYNRYYCCGYYSHRFWCTFIKIFTFIWAHIERRRYAFQTNFNAFWSL